MAGYYDDQLVQEAAGGDRLPQWSFEETKELVRIRGELDRSFMETKRNKVLWEAVSTRMFQKGFARTPDQCKSKWKNLLTRYKGCEMEPEITRQQFPFYNELHSIFSARMQSMLWAEGAGGKKTATPFEQLQLYEDEKDEEEEEEEDWETRKVTPSKAGPSSSVGGGSGRKRKKPEKRGVQGSGDGGLREVLEEFMKHQDEVEAKWREVMQAREEERRQREVEWRWKMAAMEEERLLVERGWREREEERWFREEARAQKRDALVDALLNKVARGDDI